MPEWLYGRHAVEEALKAGRRKVFRVLRAEAAKQPGTGREPGAKPQVDETISALSLARQKGIAVERVLNRGRQAVIGVIAKQQIAAGGRKCPSISGQVL